jgi:uncharacterized repeat protein (TIGR03803 family)
MPALERQLVPDCHKYFMLESAVDVDNVLMGEIETASMKLFKHFLPAMYLSVLGLLAMTARGGIVFTNLVSFTGVGGTFPGGAPYCGLVAGADGNLYGTTTTGGSNNLGTVFQLTPGGGFTSLFSFSGPNGANPYAALTPGNGGMLYGTTSAGGVSNWGTIFLITTNGAFTNLFSFTGTNNPWQGASPAAALVPDGAGNLWGTANFGGTTNPVSVGGNLQGYGYGTVFKLDSNGAVTVPVVFGGTNGIHPSGGLVLARDGNFYGTTTWGGNGFTPAFPGYGTIYRLKPDGTITNIYRFTGGADGGFIYAGLAQGSDGWLYGGAFQGGSFGYGTLFKVSTNGDFVPLHAFSFSDRGTPYAGLMQGGDGLLYGTAFGAFIPYGSVFELTPEGAYTNLAFFNNANGSYPAGVLVQGPDNNLYGTTSAGGAIGLGTIFRLSVPMPAVFKTMTVTNGAATFTWSAVAGQTYQVQYATNLTAANWTILGKNIIPTNGVITTTDGPVAGIPQRFYRVVLFP